MRTLSTVAASLAALAAATPVLGQPPSEPARDVVVTSAEAVVKHAADQAFVTVTAENRAKSPGEAQKATAERQNASAAVAAQAVKQVVNRIPTARNGRLKQAIMSLSSRRF